MLFSLALYSIAKRRGIALTLDEDADAGERLLYFQKVFYCAAITAWELKLMDDPSLGEFPYTLLDIAEWCANNPFELVKLIKGASAAIAGKEVDDSQAPKDVKKK